MENLLFLAQRIPFPPDKGDKIRSWHMLRHLARSHRVFLGCFIDDPEDARHLPQLRQVCADIACFAIPPWLRRVRSIARLKPGQPLTLEYFRDDRLRSWVTDTVARHNIRRAFVFSSSMAPYAIPFAGRRVLDLVDLDSAKWAEYAERRAWPLSLVFSREARTLAAFERHAAAAFDQTLLVSDAEAADFRLHAPESIARIASVTNGVDLGYFTAETDYSCPFPSGVVPIVFTGAMDYWPNVDAVQWFAHEVMPKLRGAGMAARFYIVGSRPARAVRRLQRLPEVEVTGRVPDIRPYLAHAFAAVAPLRVARGIQNKVLEALAMGTPMIASAAACRGLRVRPGTDLIVAADAQEWADRIFSLAAADRTRLSLAGRRWIERHHVWERNLRSLDDWFPPLRPVDQIPPPAGDRDKAARRSPEAVGGDD